MILTSGAFDGIHAGHVRCLHAASSLRCGEEEFCVVVAPDAYIRAAKDREPFWSQADRMAAVQAIAGVDRVMGDVQQTPSEMIRRERPRLFVKGADWAGKLPTPLMDACRETGTMIVYVDTPGRHVSEARG